VVLKMVEETINTSMTEKNVLRHFDTREAATTRCRQKLTIKNNSRLFVFYDRFADAKTKGD
jgi:hypothetical protein